jgi:serine/threonine protein phosphatase 1
MVQSPQVLDYLIELNTTNNCVFIRGNHDELLLHWLRDSKDNLMWYKHGGEATVLAYEKSIPLQNNYMLTFTFVKRLLSRRKEPSFVHAGFTNMNGVTYEFFPKLFYWDRTLWETALSLDQRIKPNDLLYPKRLTLYDEIYIAIPL